MTRSYAPLLLTLAAIWGASFMFIEIALDDLEPTTLMAGRCLVATIFLLSLMVATGALGKLRPAGWRAFALGVINSALPFTLIAWGQQYIDSGVAAIGLFCGSDGSDGCRAVPLVDAVDRLRQRFTAS